MVGHRMTEAFKLDEAGIAATQRRAQAAADAGGGAALLAAARRGRPLDDEALVTLLLDPAVSTAALMECARARRVEGPPQIETFSPLYVTNDCDAECLMCGMRRQNDDLVRETADSATVEAQLDILRARGVRGVAVLTGEYRHGPKRDAMIQKANRTLRAALDRGFQHVLINIGALDQPEYDVLLEGVPRDDDGRVVPHVTMCTFQETYARPTYARFMGTTPENPRADYDRRLANFDRAAAAGMKSCNPGVLLGLDGDVAFELLALLAHVRHLRAQDLTVYLSLPRLRRASGTAYAAGISDDMLCRVVALLSFGCPDGKVVISTRESPAMQRQLVPIIAVLTPGSPGVAPYTAADARFELEASQFEVLDHRPIEAILGEFLAAGATIGCYEPAARP